MQGSVLRMRETTECLIEEQEACRLRRVREAWNMGFEQRQHLRRIAALKAAIVMAVLTAIAAWAFFTF